jgi:hypothetical protein
MQSGLMVGTLTSSGWSVACFSTATRRVEEEEDEPHQKDETLEISLVAQPPATNGPGIRPPA